VGLGPHGIDVCPLDVVAPDVTVDRCLPQPEEVTLDAHLPACQVARGTTFDGRVMSVNGVAPSPEITLPSTDPSAVLPLGETIIEWTATESSGATSTIQQTVTVQEQVDEATCCEELVPGATPIHGTAFPDFLIYPQWASFCIFGEGGWDIISTGLGADFQSGGSGNDSLTSGSVGDILHGGSGDDDLTLPFGSGALYGGPGDDYLEATGTADIYGNDGDDTIVGIAGELHIYPGPGRDAVWGGANNDTIYIYDECEVEPFEVISGGLGYDTLVTPLTPLQLALRGVSVVGINNWVVTDANRHLSECN